MSSQTLNTLFNQIDALSIAEQMELLTRLAQNLQTRIVEKNTKESPQALLEKTYGIWQQEDGLVYQQKLRAEWAGR